MLHVHPLAVDITLVDAQRRHAISIGDVQGHVSCTQNFGISAYDIPESSVGPQDPKLLLSKNTQQPNLVHKWGPAVYDASVDNSALPSVLPRILGLQGVSTSGSNAIVQRESGLVRGVMLVGFRNYNRVEG